MGGGGTASPVVDAGERGTAVAPPAVDPLTGFATRHVLLSRLATELSEGSGPTLLVVFGLDGFDEYVALFGTLAGRTLLVKLGSRLADALGPEAECFRPRHDEFAVLVGAPIERVKGILDAAVAALRERAASVAVSAAWGAAMLPEETGDPVAALQLADARLASNAPRRRRRNRRASAARG
jgi:GGDEF domain-containing protein